MCVPAKTTETVKNNIRSVTFFSALLRVLFSQQTKSPHTRRQSHLFSLEKNFPNHFVPVRSSDFRSYRCWRGKYEITKGGIFWCGCCCHRRETRIIEYPSSRSIIHLACCLCDHFCCLFFKRFPSYFSVSVCLSYCNVVVRGGVHLRGEGRNEW